MARRKARGLGDTIEQITTATGIKAVVHAITEDCGCDKRRDYLNKLFPYAVECLTPEDFEYMKVFFESKKDTITIQDQKELSEIYFRVFKKRLHPSVCPSCWRDHISKLKKVYDEQNDES